MAAATRQQDGRSETTYSTKRVFMRAEHKDGWEKKRNIFAARFDEMFGVETDVVAQQWTDFYEHPNAIMHGDPVASFDENIATVALLFLLLILDAV